MMRGCFPPRDEDADEDLDDGLSFEGDCDEEEDSDSDDDDSDEEDDEDDLIDPEDLAMWDEAGASGNPSDYYFKAATAPDSLVAPIMIIITPKKYFDTEGYQWDQHISMDCGGPIDLPDYEELMEGMFAPTDENATIGSVERDLKARGFIHNPNLPC